MTVDQGFKRIKVLAMDVDGVLASPQIVLAGQTGVEGIFEIKQFCVHDGAAMSAGRAAGLIQVVWSGRDSAALRERLERMQVDAAFLGDVNKLRALEQVTHQYGVKEEEIAYVGDDFLDLPIMKRVGLPIAVADATFEMKRAAHYVTEKKGGQGAVEEVIRLILQAQGKWDWAVQEAVKQAYASPGPKPAAPDLEVPKRTVPPSRA
jgi:3-deoxy-D-manno-octulosonate 8-phosphate phosphatase (KDO 8-P phosphatase)